MKYYQLLVSYVPTPSGGVWLLEFPSQIFRGKDLTDWGRISDWPKDYYCTYPRSRFIHVDYQPCMLPIVSGKMNDLLLGIAEADVQLLPITLKSDLKGPDIHNYCYCHIVTCLDCIDRERTTVAEGVWERMPSGAFPIRGAMVLRRSAISSAKIFRVDGSWIQVFVREDVKQAIENSKLSGCRFTEIEISP